MKRILILFVLYVSQRNVLISATTVRNEGWQREWASLEEKISETESTGPYSAHPLKGDANKKHVPFLVPITRNGLTFDFGVRGKDGSTERLHPMTSDHYVSPRRRSRIS